MRVNYKGRANGYDYRIAEIYYEDRELRVLERIIQLMGIYGYQIVNSVEGWAYCEVSDLEEYKEFMWAWKKAKKCIANCEKFGF